MIIPKRQMETSFKYIQESSIYKSIEQKQEKTGNSELDKGNALLKYNSISNFVKFFVEVSFS